MNEKRTRSSAEFFDTLEASLQRIDIASSYQPSKYFSSVKCDQAISKLQQLRPYNDSCASDYTSTNLELERMPLALAASMLLLQDITDRGRSLVGLEVPHFLSIASRYCYFQLFIDIFRLKLEKSVDIYTMTRFVISLYLYFLIWKEKGGLCVLNGKL